MNCELRALEPSDVTALLEAENDQDAFMNSDNYVPFSKSVLEAYVNGQHDLIKHQQYRYVIELNGECAGFIDLFDYNPIHARAGVGVFVLKKFRKGGAATFALQRLINISKNQLNIEYLHASISEDNQASITLFKKCGFQKTGVRNGWRKEGGVRKNVCLFELNLISY